ncbi:LTA synthase family protein [Anaerotignum sp. MB30-C6]|uniref:LTA synthase family protein n=1 Tax=Anaerotignum sp. MB30-C6 TaxID=3070814 RepID=UPI0027DD9D4E|nr:LTA synthase family protein [Anaerotignum sp. MB30-C6]WMI81519.1 LTA synthase family protein [Anaerotignum sp. MB30-C6]
MPEPNIEIKEMPQADEKKIGLRKEQQITWLLFAGVSVIVTGLVFLITSEHLYLLAQNVLKNPAILFFNILPVFLFISIAYFLSGRTTFSITLTGAVFLIFAMVDKVKITMRQEPLLPADLTLAKEALTIVKTFPAMQLLLIALLLIILMLALFFSFRFSKNQRPTWKTRILGCVTFFVIAFGSNTYWYTDKELYGSYPVIDNPYFEVNQFNSKGLIYSFCHQFNITRIAPPEGYKKSTFDQIEAESTFVATKDSPHIVMIMGEAFSDLSNNPNLDFSSYRDPLKIFKEMAESENALSGKIVVPNFGGGTSNTEYDVLTACPTRYLNNPLPSYNFIHQPFDALPQRLAQAGYETLAIHPGYKWFYNRQNVYPNLGFESTYFLEDSFDLSTQGVGGYINEKATMDKILETLDTHIESSDSPLFSFTVTIQNHGPYENRFGTQAQNFDTDIPLTDTEKDLLTQYFKGITDADQELGRLRDYAQGSSQPIVIVYFGDHLPGFSNGMDFFSLLNYPIDANGTLEERLALYETPFLIWQNDAAKEQGAFSQTIKGANLPDSGIINASHLGALLTQLLEMDGLSPLYDYVNEVREILPVSTNSIFMDSNGNFTDTPIDEQKEKISKLANWQYYKLFDQTIQK